MSYYTQLHPWCIVRLLPNRQRTTVARFRRHPDAEAHLRLLRQSTPTLHYQICFDAVVTPTGHDPTAMNAHPVVVPE